MPALNDNFQEVVLQATGADALYYIEDIQSLWSGYGKIMRHGLRGADRDWAPACDARCRVPACLALEADADEFLMVFEDLDASGFPLRKNARD